MPSPGKEKRHPALGSEGSDDNATPLNRARGRGNPSSYDPLLRLYQISRVESMDYEPNWH